MKSLFTSKTFIVAVLQALIGLYAAAVQVDPTLASVGWGLIGKSVLDILLRLLTTQKAYIL